MHTNDNSKHSNLEPSDSASKTDADKGRDTPPPRQGFKGPPNDRAIKPRDVERR